MKNNKGKEEGVGVKKGGLLLKLSSLEKGAYERGGLNRGFKILLLLFFFLSDAQKNSINPAIIIASKR